MPSSSVDAGLQVPANRLAQNQNTVSLSSTSKTYERWRLKFIEVLRLYSQLGLQTPTRLLILLVLQISSITSLGTMNFIQVVKTLWNVHGKKHTQRSGVSLKTKPSYNTPMENTPKENEIKQPDGQIEEVVTYHVSLIDSKGRNLTIQIEHGDIMKMIRGSKNIPFLNIYKALIEADLKYKADNGQFVKQAGEKLHAVEAVLAELTSAEGSKMITSSDV